MLVQERSKIQKPICYINQIMRDMEIQYLKLEKLIYILLITARKLRPYFQAHTIILLMDQPIEYPSSIGYVRTNHKVDD